jgi:periplasmic mercuric ion binding protein
MGMVRIATLLGSILFAPSALAAERTVTMNVENMTCAACPITVRAAMKAVPGVKDVRVDYASKTAVVVFDDTQTTPDAMADASRLAGFPAKVRE